MPLGRIGYEMMEKQNVEMYLREPMTGLIGKR